MSVLTQPSLDKSDALVSDKAKPRSAARRFFNHFTLYFVTATILAWTGLLTPRLAEAAKPFFAPGALAVSRIVYQGNTFGNTDGFPAIFNNKDVTGVQGTIVIDQYNPSPGSPLLKTLQLEGISTSFSSKSEGALMRSVNNSFLTYMGYDSTIGIEGVSNSETPGATLTTNTAPTYNRKIALISVDGTYTLTAEANSYSGDNPRAAITVDGTQFYMAGNADSSLNSDGTGPGTTIGARLGFPGMTSSIELGVYTAADRPDETAKQHIKDSNFRAIGIFKGNLYVAKGSGGNGDDGLFQVQNGTGNGLPTGSNNTIVKLFGAPATDPVTKASSPLTPFGFFFANRKTVYVADEGNPNVDQGGNLIPDPLAGLQKWVFENGSWQMVYVIQAGLNLYQAATVPGYPAPTFTYGLRNMTGQVNGDGTVTIYAITSQFSTFSNGEPDPTRLVIVTDRISARKSGGAGEFQTLQSSKAGEVFRGVALAPTRQ